ncbi:MAG: trimethylamine methyltransferase family protein, partial [Clostridiales Family XIII bacterium]|nr:trimethylamine methyltransferase family protein [Clostridiales Family XIII bacterium]
MGRRRKDKDQGFVLDSLRYAYSRSNRLSEKDMEAIHSATMDVLGQVGVNVESPRARKYFADAGARVEGETVKIPAYIVEDAIRSAPSTVLLAGRDPKADYTIKPDAIAFINFGEGISVIDPYTKEYRRSTSKDLGMIARVVDALDVFPVVMRAVASADKPPHMQALHNAKVLFENTGKHWFIGPDGGENAKRIIAMGEKIVGGKDRLRERPLFTFNVCPTSPLQLNPTSTDGIIEGALAGIPLNIISMALSGATAPVTLAGTLVTHNAEVLAALTLAQLAHKGAPVFYA